MGETDDGKSRAAVELGRKGGIARVKRISKVELVKIAKKAAVARWKTTLSLEIYVDSTRRDLPGRTASRAFGVQMPINAATFRSQNASARSSNARSHSSIA
jgi:hypothetical protein